MVGSEEGFGGCRAAAFATALAPSASTPVHQAAARRNPTLTSPTHTLQPTHTGWLASGALQKMVLVIAGTPDGDVLERWTFDVQTDKDVLEGG